MHQEDSFSSVSIVEFRLKIVVALMVITSLLNGANVYLKKIGVLESEQYAAYWVHHCHGKGIDESALFKRCNSMTGDEINPEQLEAQRLAEKAHLQYIYDDDGAALFLKLGKYVLMVGLILFGMIYTCRVKSITNLVKSAWPLWLLFGLVVGNSIHTYFNSGLLPVVAGWHSFYFLFLALFSWGLVDRSGMDIWANGVALLIVLQLLLLLPEWLYGVYWHDSHAVASGLWKRLVGAFVHPNTLGVFAIIGLVFYYVFSLTRQFLVPLSLVVGIILLESRSGTGFICLGAVVLVLFYLRIPKKNRPAYLALAGAIAIGVLLVLPSLLKRLDLYDSLWWRMNGLQTLWGGSNSMSELLFGQGIGWDTSLGFLLSGQPALQSVGESLLSSLLSQVGIVGVILFYGTLLWGIWQRHRLSLLLLVVLLSSITSNLHVSFPVNLLLGLAFAHLFFAHRVSISVLRVD